MLKPSPVQPTYTRYQPIAQNGMLGDETEAVTDSRIVETAAGVGFGLAVSQGTGDRGCILAGNDFVGVTRADQTLPRSETLTLDKYAQYDNAGILCMGDIWVIVGGAVTITSAVVYDAATGQFGTGAVAVEGARYMTGAASGGLALLRLGQIAGNRAT